MKVVENDFNWNLLLIDKVVLVIGVLWGIGEVIVGVMVWDGVKVVCFDVF